MGDFSFYMRPLCPLAETLAWWSEERLTVLYDLAMAHLIDRKVLLPGVSVLERVVSSVREHATTRLWQLLAQLPTPQQCGLLETLLVVPEGERQTPLDRLRHAPTRVSGPALVQALHRVDRSACLRWNMWTSPLCQRDG